MSDKKDLMQVFEDSAEVRKGAFATLAFLGGMVVSNLTGLETIGYVCALGTGYSAMATARLIEKEREVDSSKNTTIHHHNEKPTLP